MKTLIASLFLLFTAVNLAAQPDIIKYYIEATQAREAKDYDGYVAGMEKALGEIPGHSILLRHIAQGHALAGRSDEAIEAIARVAGTGAYFDLSAYEEFSSLQQITDYRRVSGQIEFNHAPHGEAAVAFTVDDAMLIPEGITYDPVDDVFFLSSVYQRKVVEVGRDGAARDFIVGDDEFYCGLGMKVDARRRHLWVVTAVFNGMRDYDKALDGRSSVSCYDIESGQRLRHIALADGEQAFTFNDLELDADGNAYVTDTGMGAVYIIEAGSDSLGEAIAPGILRGANGIALDREHELLYVARYGLDIVAVDLSDRSVVGLDQTDDVALFGVDGLYLHDGALIAIQNHPSLDRIARFTLSRDGRRVTGAEVLVRRHELFDEPTTGVVVEGKLYFIGNSQIETFAQSDAAARGNLQPVRILELPLAN